MARTALYAGSFDPPTIGHVWMMEQGAALFDELLVVLAVNPEKRGFLSLEQRETLLKDIIAGLPGNVRLEVIEQGFLVDFARELGAGYLLRGLRNASDFEYEKSMSRLNARMEPGIQSVLLTAPSAFEQVSSTVVRGFVGTRGWERWVAAFVPPSVLECLKSLPTPQS